MKRFWDTASVRTSGEGWVVTLDDRPMRLPGGRMLTLEPRPLADAVAAEWQAAGGARGGEMSYSDLPLTRLAGTAQERIAPDPEPVILELARFGETDLLCYRAEQPEALLAVQDAEWQPWLDWAADTYRARLRPTQGIVHVAQDPAALASLAGALASLSPLALAALGVAVPASGSLVLGLAMASLRLDAAEAHRLATLDERFQAELWGDDAEASTRRHAIAADMDAAGRLLALTGKAAAP